VVTLGLTGSIGMGKTRAARAFARLGAAVFEADAAVHAVLAPGGAAVSRVVAAFPDVLSDGGVDRQTLGRIVFADAAALARLEEIVHPLVRQAERGFLAAARRRRVALAVLDIPLLFETGASSRFDATAVVSAPRLVQRARVLRRPGMTVARLAAILDHQMPDREKRRHANFIIRTGLDRGFTLRRIRDIVTMLTKPRRLTERPRLTMPLSTRLQWSKTCARSSLIPKPPVSIPRPGTG
jgi:dephospho-CoA kinase